MAENEVQKSKEDVLDECAKQVSDLCGMSVAGAKMIIVEANKRLGVGPKTYVKHAFYNMSEAEQKEAYAKIRKKTKDKNFNLLRRAEQVAADSDMTISEAKEALRRARAELGVGYKAYVEHRFYMLDWEDQVELAAELGEAREARESAKEEALAQAARELSTASGMGFDEARDFIAEAGERLGIGPKTYVRHRFDQMNFAEQEQAYEAILKRSEKRGKQLDKRAREVALASSMGYDEARESLRRAKAELGIGYAAFIENRLYELDWQGQVDFVANLEDEQKIGSFARMVADELSLELDEAKRMLREMKSTYGLSYADLIENHMYDQDDEARAETARQLNEERAAKKAEQDAVFAACAADLADLAGMEPSEAEGLLRKANERLGVGPKTYVRHRFDQLSFADQEREYADILARAKKRRKQLNDRAREVAMLSDLGYEEAKESLKRARAELGVGYKAYLDHRFYDLTWENQEKEAERLKAIGLL